MNRLRGGGGIPLSSLRLQSPTNTSGGEWAPIARPSPPARGAERAAACWSSPRFGDLGARNIRGNSGPG
eukprot:8907110-Pyramimonas_sp.AAC.1